MFWIARGIIGDFTYLKDFHIEGIVSMLISVCVCLVLVYQSIEQNKKLPDHSAKTKWLNQKLNMLHLFRAFFLFLPVGGLYRVLLLHAVDFHSPAFVALRVSHFLQEENGCCKEIFPNVG